MKRQKTLLFGALLMAVTSQAFGQAQERCPDKIAADLLAAITTRNEIELIRIANNPDVFDKDSIKYLIGGEDFRFPGRGDLRSAYAVLKNQKVLTKMTVTEKMDRSTELEVIFLPGRAAGDFIQLANMTKAKRTRIFRDYVLCKVIIRAGIVSMPHACYAETDAVEAH
jgi:hypothetical protein